MKVTIKAKNAEVVLTGTNSLGSADMFCNSRTGLNISHFCTVKKIDDTYYVTDKFGLKGKLRPVEGQVEILNYKEPESDSDAPFDTDEA